MVPAVTNSPSWLKPPPPPSIVHRSIVIGSPRLSGGRAVAPAKSVAATATTRYLRRGWRPMAAPPEWRVRVARPPDRRLPPRTFHFVGHRARRKVGGRKERGPGPCPSSPGPSDLEDRSGVRAALRRDHRAAHPPSD